MPKYLFLPPLDDFKRDFAEHLSDALPELTVVAPETEEEMMREIVDADGAYGWVPPEALAVAEKLTWLQNPDSGSFYGYYYKELIDHPVTISNPRGIYWDHIGHHVMMFVLALAKGMPYYMGAKADRRWDKEARKSQYINLPDATVLIYGVGGIGAEVARMSHAFGASVIGVEPRPEYDLPFVEMHTPDQLNTLLQRADFVVSTVPHTPETEGVWNANAFRLMKPTSYLINVGRGKTMKIDELADAIENGEIAGCGLDVFETEPLPSDHKLWGLENVMITPHIAVRDAEDLPDRRFEIVIENARRFLAGESFINVVDKEKWY